jgi:hypothetical protein
VPALARVVAHLLTFCVVTTTVIALGSSSAQARDGEEPYHCFDSCTFHDAKGDAPKRADIRSGRVEHRTSSFFVKFRIKSLPKHGMFVVGAGLSGWGTNWRVTKSKHGTSVVAWAISEVQVYPATPCPSAKVTWNRKQDLVKAVLPHECTGGNASGGSVFNGIDFSSGNAKDSAGKVFYAP